MADVDFQQLFGVLQSMKAVFWAENPQLSEEHRQSMWEQRCAPMWSHMLASPQLQTPDQDVRKQPSRKRPMERSASSIVFPPSKRQALDTEIPQAAELRRYASAPSAPVMTRETSATSKDAGFGHALIDASTVIYNDQSLRPRRPRYPDDVKEFTVEDFLSVIPEEGPTIVPHAVSPNAVDTGAAMQSTSLHANSIHDLEQYEHLDAHSTALSEAMARAPTLSSERMSRTTTNEMICCPLDMLRLNSSMSTDKNSEPSPIGDYPSKALDVTFPFSSSSSSTFPTDATVSPQSAPIFTTESSVFPTTQSFQPTFLSSTSMQSSSTQSDFASSSCSSLQSRASRRTQEQIAHSIRPIAPKAKEEMASSTARMVRVSSEDGKLKEVAQIPKTVYQRPTKPKTYCNLCEDHPEGFHGDHELRRHKERVHARVRKVWICKEKDPKGTFLANCKACRRRKTYGANYNAAAHLRRTHFHPCKKGRGGRGKPSEKRGGKGGGDDPPMEELRHWMYETEEVVEPDDLDVSVSNGEYVDSPSDSDYKNDVLDYVGSLNTQSSPTYAVESSNHAFNGYLTPAAIPRYQAIPMSAEQMAFFTGFADMYANPAIDQGVLSACGGYIYPPELACEGEVAA